MSAPLLLALLVCAPGCFLLDGRERRATHEADPPASEPGLAVTVESARALVEAWQGYAEEVGSDLHVSWSAAHDGAEPVEIVGVSEVTVTNPTAGLTQTVTVWEQDAVVVAPGETSRSAFRGAIRSNELGVCSALDAVPDPPPAGTLRLAATFHTGRGDVRVEDVPVEVQGCIFTE